ncbi:plastocyanin/azurin family copper-binding protein [uncultured Imperialibacter sp.]|uniref:plastocyanin/azurin family copper-binding protein n=1 Tax=uncultured Imperialibacter sp. TaxID=1672639 RepID=UPI0030D956C7
MKFKNTTSHILLILFIGLSASVQAQTDIQKKEAAHFSISKVPIPSDIVLEVGGLAFDDNGKLGVSTRRGDIWLIENPSGSTPIFKKYATGLHEPLGLAFRDGIFYTAQRGELTRLSDLNKDGKADRYETIYSWPLAANYHEYSYGPLILPNGDMIVTLNLGWVGRGASLSKWHGWMVKITPDGKMTPIAVGMRSPAGFNVNAEGDIFYAENQGDWVGSGRMTHIESGDFVGHPEGLKWSGEKGSPISLKMEDIVDTLGYTLHEYAQIVPEMKAPSVWFPHTLMGISTSDILLIDNDNFGPFKNQFLVGDQGHSKIMRVYQEKVNGQYQGVCFPFREGFSSGILRMQWSPKRDVIYVGMTSRGWSSTGQDNFGLEKLQYTGKLPFEMKTIRALEDGFSIEFTEKVDLATASNPSNYSVQDFTYLYHHNYGSPVTDLQKRNITSVEVSSDQLRVKLVIDQVRDGYIYEVKPTGVKNSKGQTLLHNTGYYTMNNVPGRVRGSGESADHSDHKASAAGTTNVTSSKRVVEMPASWTNGPDQTVTLEPVPGLKFDQSEITVKAGSKIKMEFNNPDDMLHNMVIVKPGAADKIAQLAIDLGLEGQSKAYVPEAEEVLYHTKLIGPGEKDVIYFEAPTAPGRYTYVCTFPGHAASMRGTLIVE